jgi:hypothetical protein
MRTVLVFHQSWMLILSPAFGRSMTRAVHLRHSTFLSIPTAIYIFMLVVFSFIWRSPFDSLADLPLLFFYFTVTGCVCVITLQTLLIKCLRKKVIFSTQACIFLECFHFQLHLLHKDLDKFPKRPADLEMHLARVARQRTQLNAFAEEVGAGVGPVVAVTVFAVTVRLSCTLLINVKTGFYMYSTGQLPPLTDLFIAYPRTILVSFMLAALAHAGQGLKDEVRFWKLIPRFSQKNSTISYNCK